MKRSIKCFVALVGKIRRDLSRQREQLESAKN